jgi:hypothetical protein
MRLSASRKLGVGALCVVALAIAAIAGHRALSRAVVSAVKCSIAHSVEGARAQGADTTGASGAGKTRVKSARDGTVSIRIDESGIRIDAPQGEGGETDSSAERIIFDSKGWPGTGSGRQYKESGADVVRFGEDVSVEANELVRGDVVVFGGDVSIAGKVVGDVVVLMGDARVVSGAEINGDMVVIGGTLDEQDEVIIHGERVILRKFNISMMGFPFVVGRQFRLFEFFVIPVKFFISLVLSFLVVLFLRDRIIRSHEHVVSGVLKSFGTGFLVAFVGVFAVTFLAIILLITLIGIPLAFVLVVSCIALFFVAGTVFVYTLGSKVSEKLNIQTANPFAIVLVGTAVLYLPALLGFGLSLLPFGGFVGGFLRVFGVFLGLFAFLAGLGALFLSRFGARGVIHQAPAAGPAAPR